MMHSKCIVCNQEFYIHNVSNYKPKVEHIFWLFCKYFYSRHNHNGSAESSNLSFKKDTPIKMWTIIPFCTKCIKLMDTLTELEDKLQLIQNEIQQVVAQVSYSIVKSTESDQNDRHDLMTNVFDNNDIFESIPNILPIKLEPDEDTWNTNGDQIIMTKEVASLRRSICQRLNPKVFLKDCRDQEKFQSYVHRNSQSNPLERENHNNDNYNEDDGLCHDFDIEFGLDQMDDCDEEFLPTKRKKKKVLPSAKSKKKIKSNENSDVTLNKRPYKKKKKIIEAEEEMSSTSKVIRVPRKLKKSVRISETVFCYADKWNYEKLSPTEFKCYTCGGICTSKFAVVRHININHNQERTRCEICHLSWNEPSRMVGHKCMPEGRRTKKRVLVCGEGKYLYDGKWPFEKLNEVTDGCEYKCNTCNVLRKNRKEINEHLRLTHSTTKYMCSFCGLCFTNPKSYSSHATVHATEKLFICDQCGHSCRSRHLLYMHLKVHSNIKYTCEICRQEFKHRSGLLRHKQRLQHLTDEDVRLREKWKQQRQRQGHEQELELEQQQNSQEILIPDSITTFKSGEIGMEFNSNLFP